MFPFIFLPSWLLTLGNSHPPLQGWGSALSASRADHSHMVTASGWPRVPVLVVVIENGMETKAMS